MQIEGTCIDLNNSFTMVYGAPGSGKSLHFFFIGGWKGSKNKEQRTKNKEPRTKNQEPRKITFRLTLPHTAFFVNEITKQFISEQQQRRQSKTKAIHTLSLNGKLHTNHRHSLQALLVQISGQEKRNGATQSQLKVWFGLVWFALFILFCFVLFCEQN